MQLKVSDRQGQNEYVVVLNGEELYEIICCQLYYLLNDSGKVPKEKLDEAVVMCVLMSHTPEYAAKNHEISDPFVRMVLSECNRLGINLPG